MQAPTCVAYVCKGHWPAASSQDGPHLDPVQILNAVLSQGRLLCHGASLEHEFVPHGPVLVSFQGQQVHGKHRSAEQGYINPERKLDGSRFTTHILQHPSRDEP